MCPWKIDPTFLDLPALTVVLKWINASDFSNIKIHVFLDYLQTPCMWWAKNWQPKDVHVLISGTFECVTLPDERDLANVIKLKILRRGDYPGLFRQTQCSHKGPDKGQWDTGESEGTGSRSIGQGHVIIDFEVGILAASRSWKRWRLSLQKEPSATGILIVAQWGNGNIIHLYCF